MAWWTHDRFGMFIHFGLYAMPARHEWIRHYENIKDEDYQKYFERFNPDLFDAREWARAAKKAGMKYMVLTTKHHEGFCLWDSKFTDYKITNTPFGRDLVKEYVEAARAEGLHVGFYYSLIDWHHPDFTVDPVTGPYRTLSKEKMAERNKGRDMARYRQYMKDQVTELLSNYGKIDIIWYDFSYPRPDGSGKDHNDWDSEGLIRLTRKLQPWIIVDNRLDLLETTNDGWDFITPEQFKVTQWPTWKGQEVPWETCQTFSGSWGYFRDETSWKSSRQLIELLVHTVSFGGNLIMNVGPTARGEFDYRAQDRLEAYAKWMHANSRAIYGCTRAPKEFTAPENTLLTYNPDTNRIYIHLLAYPMQRLYLPFGDKVEYAQFLHDGSELFVKDFKRGSPQNGDFGEAKYIELPVVQPNVEIPVIEIYLRK